MPPRVFYLENAFMGVSYSLKYGCAADLPECG